MHSKQGSYSRRQLTLYQSHFFLRNLAVMLPSRYFTCFCIHTDQHCEQTTSSIIVPQRTISSLFHDIPLYQRVTKVEGSSVMKKKTAQEN